MSPYIAGGLALVLSVGLGLSHLTAYRHGKHVAEGEWSAEALKAVNTAEEAARTERLRVEAARRDLAEAQNKAGRALSAAIRKGKVHVENHPRPECRPDSDLRGVLDSAVDAANRSGGK